MPPSRWFWVMSLPADARLPDGMFENHDSHTDGHDVADQYAELHPLTSRIQKFLSKTSYTKMSVQLHPDIETLDKESLCYSIYAQLYHNFFNAQQKKRTTSILHGIEGRRRDQPETEEYRLRFCIRHCRSRYGRRWFRKRWFCCWIT